MFFRAASLHQCMVRWSRSQWTTTSWKVRSFSWRTRTHSRAVERINLSRSERIWTDTLVATDPGHRFIICCSSIQPCCIILQFTSSSNSGCCFFILFIRIQMILFKFSLLSILEVHPKWSNSVHEFLNICFRRRDEQFMTNTSMDVKLIDSVWIQTEHTKDNVSREEQGKRRESKPITEWNLQIQSSGELIIERKRIQI